MQRPALSGSFGEFGAEDILGLLDLDKTGTLTVQSEREGITVYFVKGVIVDAEHHGIPQLTLGELLSRTGHLTTQQLQQVSILGLGNQRRVGAVLVELGLIPGRLLEDFLFLRIKNAVRQLFLWQAGTFAFLSGAPSLGAGPLPQVSVQAAIDDGRHFRLEWSRLGGRIRSLDSVVQMVHQPPKGAVDELSQVANQALGFVDGGSSTRVIAQCLFVDDLEALKAIDELLHLGLVRVVPLPDSAGPAARGPSESGSGTDDLIRLLAKSQVIPAAKSHKPGDRIKTLLKVLQDCVNDLLTYQDSQFSIGSGADPDTLAGEYLEQRFSEILAKLQAQYPSLEALQLANRRVDTSDLVETYNLILGDTRQAFYMEAVRGLSALVKAVFDWVVGDDLDNPTVASESQAAWRAFFREIENKVAELTDAEGLGKQPVGSPSLRGKR